MRMTPRLLINLVTVLLLGVVTVGWVLVSLVGGGAFDEPWRVVADFKASGGVYTEQEVTYRGVAVGRVGELSLNETGVDIELLLEPEWEDRIPANVTARVQSKSAVGEQFVNLIPDGTSEQTLADGDEIARADTRLPVDFQRLLATVDRVLADLPPQQTRRTVKNLGEGLAGSGGDIAVILRSLGTLSDTFAEVAPEQQRLLSSATRAGSAFLATKDEFAGALAAVDRVAAGIGDEPEELEALLAQNDRLAQRGLALLDRHGADLQAGIRGLADLMGFQLRSKREVLGSLDHVPDFMRAVEAASIPWTSPEGRQFYRIRVGLVVDNVPATWPCKYEVDLEYPRYPFEREEREPYTAMECLDETVPTETYTAGEELVAALEGYAAERDAAAAQTAALLSGYESIPGESLIWPLTGPVTSGFGPRWDRLHAGVDIDGVTGDPVVAARAGTVTFAGTQSGYGNFVVVDHGDGMSTLYAHLSRVDVAAGQILERGWVVGAVGCTGTCFGDHLHFEVRLNGVAVDPLLYLPGGPLFVGGSAGDLHLDPQEAPGTGTVEGESETEAAVEAAAP